MYVVIDGAASSLERTDGQTRGGVKIAVAVIPITIALVATAINPSFASQRVPRTIVGCVVHGAFVSSDGYRIHPRYGDGREVDLRAFEGSRLILRGDLLPGDVMIIKTPPRGSSRCLLAR